MGRSPSSKPARPNGLEKNGPINQLRHSRAVCRIDAGAIELVFEGLGPTEESAPPEDALLIEPHDPRYNPYVNLAGWEG